MNNAIKLAIEKGGYAGSDYARKQVIVRGWDIGKQAKAVMTQDQLFWQSLDKVLGWNDLVCLIHGIPDGCKETHVEKWAYYAHQYLDVVLTGGDTEQFWKDLLTKNQ